jgi:hypothetical protein
LNFLKGTAIKVRTDCMKMNYCVSDWNEKPAACVGAGWNVREEEQRRRGLVMESATEAMAGVADRERPNVF